MSLPHSPESERALVAALLVFPRSALVEAQQWTSPADLYSPPLSALFAAIVAVDKASKPVDSITVVDEMTRTGKIGMLRALAEGSEPGAALGILSADAVGSEAVGFHAQKIAGLAAARRLLETAAEITARGQRAALDWQSYRDECEQLLFEALSAGDGASVGPHSLGKGLRRVMKAIEERVDERANPKPREGQIVRVISTGIAQWDALMRGGFRAGGLYVIAGRPGHGKTSLAKDAWWRAGAAGIPALDFSLEMDEDELLETAIASHGQIDATRFTSGDMGKAHMSAMYEAGRALDNPMLQIDDEGGLSMAQIAARARRWRLRSAPIDEHPVALVVVDYLQLITGTRGKYESREQQVAEISQALKNLARRLRVAVVALAQLNREVEKDGKRKPRMSDLRESGSIEANADFVGILHTTAEKIPGKPLPVDLVICKQRKGPSDVDVPLWFEPHFTRFTGRDIDEEASAPKPGRRRSKQPPTSYHEPEEE